MRILIIFLAATALLGASPALAASPCTGAKMNFEASSLSGGDIRDLETKLRVALDKVCNWWGPSFKGPFNIEVRDDRGPAMALIPAWKGNRGDMLFRARNRINPAITHEMTHVFAPNGNRFLAEGLATYSQEHLSDAEAYPNFGRDLHNAARELAEKADFAALDAMATPSRLKTDDLDGDEAYQVAGSFVRFLVESYGLDRFRKLYALTPLESYSRDAGERERWNNIYGKGLNALAAEWREKIAG